MRYNPANAILLILVVELICSACELSVEGGKYQERLVVFGHLVADSPFEDTVSVSITHPIGETADDSTHWISDALITISDDRSSFCLSPIPSLPGHYRDDSWQPHFIQAATTYSLTVKWEGLEVGAYTDVPDTFTIGSMSSMEWNCQTQAVLVRDIDFHTEWNSQLKIAEARETGDFRGLKMDQLVYREGSCYNTSRASIPLFILQWKAEHTTGSEIARVSTFALTPTMANAIVDTGFAARTFKGPMLEDSDGNLYRPRLITINSTLTIIPINWLYFNYYGPHLITIEVGDESLNDYLAGSAEGYNPFIPPSSNITNGNGLFYSSYSRTFLVDIRPDPNLGMAVQ